jgi:Zn-dependent protease with chaperone function
MRQIHSYTLKQLLVHLILAVVLLCSQWIITTSAHAQHLSYPAANSYQAYHRVYQSNHRYPVKIRKQLYLAAQINTQAHGGLQTPESILAELIRANNIPANIIKGISVDKSDSLNAATDGSGIIITQALLNKLTTNDERAFVISHELSHVVLNHIGKTQTRRVGLSLVDNFIVRRFAKEGSLLQLASSLGIGLVDKRSSRTLEYQADDLGVRLMKDAGYNPKAALQVFGILKAATPNNGTPEFLQDHPITDSRVRILVEKYKL